MLSHMDRKGEFNKRTSPVKERTNIRTCMYNIMLECVGLSGSYTPLTFYGLYCRMHSAMLMDVFREG